MKIWIIEMWTRSGWRACEACSLTRSYASMMLREWEKSNPDDKFRVARYVRAAGEGEA